MVPLICYVVIVTWNDPTNLCVTKHGYGWFWLFDHWRNPNMELTNLIVCEFDVPFLQSRKSVFLKEKIILCGFVPRSSHFFKVETPFFCSDSTFSFLRVVLQPQAVLSCSCSMSWTWGPVPPRRSRSMDWMGCEKPKGLLEFLKLSPKRDVSQKGRVGDWWDGVFWGFCSWRWWMDWFFFGSSIVDLLMVQCSVESVELEWFRYLNGVLNSA